MSKKDNTLLLLEAALDRILRGESQKIAPSRKLSVRAVEVESGLGNGSAYYHTKIIEKIKQIKNSSITTGSLNHQKALKAEKLKNKFRDENIALKLLNSQIAADQYRQMSTLRDALQRILELEKTIEELNIELVETRRKNITLFKQ